MTNAANDQAALIDGLLSVIALLRGDDELIDADIAQLEAMTTKGIAHEQARRTPDRSARLSH